MLAKNNFFLTLLYVESNIEDYNTKLLYPEVTRICYHLIQDIYLFLKTPQGQQLILDVHNKKVLRVVFLPVEPYLIGYYEKNIFSKIQHLFDSKKFSIYCTDFLSDDFKNISYGFIVLEAMQKFLNTNVKVNPTKHYLTLNKRKKIERVTLYNFLEKNNLLNQGICSFHWLEQSPDLKIFGDRYDDVIQKQIYLDDIKNFYKETLFEIVSPSGTNLISEKTLKPLLFGKPFLIWNYEFLDEEDFETYKLSGFSKEVEMFNKTLFYFNWYKNIGIDINYFNLDLNNPNCIKNKIKELCSMSLLNIQYQYEETFQKAKLNQKIIRKFLYNKFNEWNISIHKKKVRKNLDI